MRVSGERVVDPDGYAGGLSAVDRGGGDGFRGDRGERDVRRNGDEYLQSGVVGAGVYFLRLSYGYFGERSVGGRAEGAANSGMHTHLVDGYSGATPLGDAAAALSSGTVQSADAIQWSMGTTPIDWFYGLIPGSIGETSTLAILIGAFVLIWTGWALGGLCSRPWSEDW